MTKIFRRLFIFLFIFFISSIMIQNITIFIIPIICVNLFAIYYSIKVPINRNHSKKQVTNIINVDCKEITDYSFLALLLIFYILPALNDFRFNTLSNFFNASFKQQFIFLSLLTFILISLLLLFVSILEHNNIKNKVFDEGIIFNDGVLHSWDELTGYKFGYLVAGSKYVDLTLDYGSISKTLRINKKDLHIYEDLMNKKYFKIA
ncbi:hypothetical protein [Romboutsia sp. 1001713B170131_170501_G6]|uniref:hypothetical protein n=1 Tax=Romboutsia sp. 1001713B170131_170501_G6 TaxID=2787108 RepID=UPI0018ABD305|nr:hypothetical protein [Romboutsia sp. 1001713B170131_170501_G6]